MNDTTITLIGNLTADPELKFTQGGHAVAEFTVASTPRRYDKQAGEWVDGDSLFIRCTVWREAAENVAESLTKGTRVIVSGNLKVRQFERKDGTKGTSVECDVQEVGPSLRSASARVTRAERRPTAAAAAGTGWGTSAGDTPPF